MPKRTYVYEDDFLIAFEKAQATAPSKSRVAAQMLFKSPVWANLERGYQVLDNLSLARQLAIHFHFTYGDKPLQDSSHLISEWEIDYGGEVLKLAEKRAIITMFFDIYTRLGAERAKQWLNS